MSALFFTGRLGLLAGQTTLARFLRTPSAQSPRHRHLRRLRSPSGAPSALGRLAGSLATVATCVAASCCQPAVFGFLPLLWLSPRCVLVQSILKLS